MAANPPLMPVLETLSKASLYVGDLDPEATEKDLAEAFSKIGQLASVRLCRDRVSHKSLRYAYVNFFSPFDAAKALDCLNHTEIKGKPMRIMWCQRDSLTRKSGMANLFIKNLDPSVTSAKLHDIFCKFGTILSCKVAEENGKCKGFGYVQFDPEDSSMAALSLNGTILDGKKLHVSKFVKKSERKDAQEESKFTNLYVKNLGEDVTENLLQDKFSEFGKVSEVVIVRDAEGKSRGCGFVIFNSHEEAKKAMEALNGTLLGLKKLSVGKAQKDHHTEKSKASNLYVKNLDASIDDKKLQDHFSAYGEITSAKVMRYDNGFSKGFGFVCFSTPEEAKKALNALQGTILLGKYLYVAIAQGKEERRMILQAYYAQQAMKSFYSYYSNMLVPQLRAPHCNFPVYHPKKAVSHTNSSCPTVYPSAEKSYSGNFLTFVRKSYGFFYCELYFLLQFYTFLIFSS
ncbi:polyadenylate-binding protein 6-like [Cornus florida]|uniref:polyadenylate-binding protein 6-like n=1 Tax=Cornus florida TaxID=4283 RepID=UPI00289E96FD|nr:polyadenylate-binding protein 6-like [Cornus florida]